MKNIRTSAFVKVAYPMAKIKLKHDKNSTAVDAKGNSRAGKPFSYAELRAHPDQSHINQYHADRDRSNQLNDQFLADHPASPENLVNTFHRATPDEYNEGKNWYPGANYAAHIIARDASRNTGKKVTADQVAGLLANYSPQMPWHQNMMWASMAAHGVFPGDGGAGWKSPHDGKGAMVTKAQAEAAKSIMGGNDWRQVLGKLKIGNFGGNIATGGVGAPKKDSEDVGADEGTGHSRPKITIDRHALSGVHGEYADEGVYNRSGLDKPKVYDQYVDHFANATKQINDMHGDTLTDPGLQAVAWLVQQRENGEKGHTAAKNATVSKSRFDNYAQQFHPDLVDNTPGVGFQGAGGATRMLGGDVTPHETYHGMNSWDEDVAQGIDPHPNHPIAAGGAPVAQPAPVFANPMHPLNANNKTMAERNAAQPKVAKTAASSQKDWKYDPVSDQYKTSNLEAKFACNCGSQFVPESFYKCSCGKSYASFDIVPQDKTAASITRIMRPVKEHRDRILANKNYASLNPFISNEESRSIAEAVIANMNTFSDQVKKNVKTANQERKDYIRYLNSFPEFKKSAASENERDDDPDYQSADSSKQEPDHTQSVEVSNEFTEGLKPLHDTSLPFYTRTDHSEDEAPVVFEKNAGSSIPDYIRVPVGRGVLQQHMDDIAKYDDPAFHLEDKPKNPQWGSEHNPAPVTTRQVAPKNAAGPVVPRHLNPANPGGPQWNQTLPGVDQVYTDQGVGSVQKSRVHPRNDPAFEGSTGYPDPYGSKTNNPDFDPTHDNFNIPNTKGNNFVGFSPDQDAAKAEVEKKLVDPALSQGRHHAKKETMNEFNEADFRMGYLHGANDGGVPERTASRSFVEGYVEALKEVVGDRAPGWDTVAPAFEKIPKGETDSMDDNINTARATDDGEFHEVRKELGDKLDSDNRAGQSRGNGTMLDLEGWKGKNSSIDLSEVHTAALAREIARRSNAV